MIRYWLRGWAIGAEHYGKERAQTAEAMAEQIIAAELKRRRSNEAAQDATQGGSGKGGVSSPLRTETTKTVGWIAERLGMGSRGYLNHLLYRQRKSGRK